MWLAVCAGVLAPLPLIGRALIFRIETENIYVFIVECSNNNVQCCILTLKKQRWCDSCLYTKGVKFEFPALKDGFDSGGKNERNSSFLEVDHKPYSGGTQSPPYHTY